jgi:PAS domain S-box-containing protein
VLLEGDVLRVLVVGSHDAIQDLRVERSRLLSGQDLDVFDSHEAALEAAASEVYDCVVLLSPTAEQFRQISTLLNHAPAIVVAPADLATELTAHVPDGDLDVVFAEDLTPAHADEIAARITNAVRREARYRRLSERYEQMAQSVSGITYALDNAGRFTFLNQQVGQLGYEPEELVGRHFTTILDPAVARHVSRAEVLKHYQGRATGALGAPKLFDERRRGRRKTSGLQVRLLPKSGAHAEPMLGSVTAYGEVERHTDGTVECVGTVGLIHDITMARKSEDTLRRLYTAVDSSASGCVIFDDALRTEYVNPTFYRFSGFGPDELIGKTVDQLNAVGLDHAVQAGLHHVRSTGEPWSGSVFNRNRRGDRYQMDARINPVRDGSTLCAYVLLLDPRSRRTTDAETARGPRVMQEVRTPLWSIVGLADLTLATNLSEEQRGNLEMIRYSARGVLELIASGADAPYEAEWGTAVLGDLLRSAARPFQFDVRERFGTMAIRCLTDERTILGLSVDPTVQLVQQMLARAVENLSHATVTLTAELMTGDAGSAEASSSLRIAVQYPAAHSAVAEEVSQVDLFSHAASALGGVASEDGGQTRTLTIEIPVTVVQSGGRTRAQSTGDRLRDYRVLVAEDDLINQKVTTQMLRKLGNQVTAVSNGVEAVQAAKEDAFDIILMDINMPAMDGIEATRRIRSSTGFFTRTDVPVVALTAYALPEDRIRFLSSGLDESVVKPVDWSRLFGIMLGLLGPPGAQEEHTQTVEGAAMIDDYDIASFVDAYRGSPEVMQEILAIFEEETPGKLDRLESALAEGDLHTVGRTAHSLANTAGTLRAPAAVDAARETETAARDGNIQAARAAAARLSSVVREMLRQISALDR